MPPQLLSSATTLQHPPLLSSRISRQWESQAAEQSTAAVTFTAGYSEGKPHARRG